MMEDLDRLIAAVENGEARNYHFDDVFGVGPIGNHAIGANHDSLDAAMALHKALLPNEAKKMGYFITFGFAGCAIIHGGCNDQLSEDIESGEVIQKDNPARAWLLCILKAHRHNLANGAAQ